MHDEPIRQMTRMLAGTEDWRYIYTAGDERFWAYRVGGGGSLWALRDLDGRLLREYEAHTSWGNFKDYIYRGTQLLASEHPTEGGRHFHLDHLGTPRLVTTAGTGGDFFTLTPCRAYDTRLLSVPLNPLVYVDPTGELLVFAGSQANLEKLRKLVNDSLHGYELVINKNGTAQLVSNNVQGSASPEQAALAGVTGTGVTVIPQAGGSQTVTVVIQWINGNIFRVIRR